MEDAAEPVLICDPRVLDVPIEGRGEPRVDVREYPFLVNEEHPWVGSVAETRFFCRRSVAERLRRADELLPGGRRLLILECHRPVELQAGTGRKTCATFENSILNGQRRD